MKTAALVFSMMLCGVLLFAAPCLAADYWVYCVKGRGTVVDTRNVPKYTFETGVKSGDVKVINKFSNQKDAELAAKNSRSSCK